MTQELQICLSAVLATLVLPLFVQIHWLFGIVWLVAVGTAITYAVRLIWGLG